MDIKEFVKESLLQLAESINEANAELEERGAYIPSGDMIGEGVLFTEVKGTKTRHFVKVEFDLAVTVSQEQASNGGGGLSIASFANLGVKSESKEGKVDVSRIKFMIPMVLPQKK